MDASPGLGMLLPGRSERCEDGAGQELVAPIRARRRGRSHELPDRPPVGRTTAPSGRVDGALFVNSLHRAALAWSGRRMPVLPSASWRELTEGARELARDRHGRRTLLTVSGETVVKEFGPARLLSSALLDPYACRFVRNARALRELGIGAPEAKGPWRLPDGTAHVATYDWREGRELREVVRGAGASAAVHGLGRFLARLHRAGADFRAGHFGNFVVDPAGEFSVIDCVDVRFHDRALKPRVRARALMRLLHREDADRDVLIAFPLPLCAGYFGAAGMSEDEALETWIHLPGELSEQGFVLEDLLPASA